MLLRVNERFRCTGSSFNMTPVVDIVFLLIVFFVVVFQFIGPDNPVRLPEGCTFAESLDGTQPSPATIVMRTTAQGRITCLVGTDEIQASNKSEMARMLKNALEKNLKDLPESERIVVLRIDKNVSYEDAQYALAAAAQTSARGLRLATLAQMHTDKD